MILRAGVRMASLQIIANNEIKDIPPDTLSRLYLSDESREIRILAKKLLAEYYSSDIIDSLPPKLWIKAECAVFVDQGAIKLFTRTSTFNFCLVDSPTWAKLDMLTNSELFEFRRKGFVTGY